jgi:hypothetical protein
MNEREPLASPLVLWLSKFAKTLIMPNVSAAFANDGLNAGSRTYNAAAVPTAAAQTNATYREICVFIVRKTPDPSYVQLCVSGKNLHSQAIKEKSKNILRHLPKRQSHSASAEVRY